jgi:hypothetical protein
MFCGLLVKSCQSIQALADQAKEIGVPGIRRLVVECVLKRVVNWPKGPGPARRKRRAALLDPPSVRF